MLKYNRFFCVASVLALLQPAAAHSALVLFSGARPNTRQIFTTQLFATPMAAVLGDDCEHSNALLNTIPEKSAKTTHSTTIDCSTSLTEASSAQLMSPLYGKVKGHRVRVRVAPQCDAAILKELDQDHPLEICHAITDFYVIKAPNPMKGYIFRTYVLDDKIEGDRVNLRLEPSAQATILAQLARGAPATGRPSPSNPKWLEIDLPESVHFYISKDYVDIIEQQEFFQLSQKQKKEQLNALQLCMNNPAQPDQESQERNSSLSKDEQTTAGENLDPNSLALNELLCKASDLDRWQKQEEELQQEWLQNHAHVTTDDYHFWQQSSSTALTGSIKRYEGPKVAPGDFILTNGQRTLALLYSIESNLSDYQDKKVTIRVVERDNHLFAYPAYCVLSIKEAEEETTCSLNLVK